MESQNSKVILESPEPMKVAQWLLDTRFTADASVPALVYFNGEWWEWFKDRWHVRDQEWLQDQVYPALEDATYLRETQHGTVRKRLSPTPELVRGVLQALRSKARRDYRETPVWLRGHREKPSPADQVAFDNSLYDLKTGKQMVRDATWFDHQVLPVELDPNAKCPLWLKCLEQWSCGDEDWKTLLQRWFGYCLMNHRNYDKWLLMYGKSRAGKGVIARMLKRLLGETVMVSRSLEDLNGEFGLQGLQRARVLNLTELNELDAKSAGRVASIIKRVVGRDPQRINIKHGKALENVIINAAIMVQTNEIPKLPDVRGGVSNKMLVLPFNWSALDAGNKPDPDLDNKLAEELQGVAMWALEGAKALVRGEGWPTVASAEAAMEVYESENNIFDSFLNDRCVRSEEGFVATALLWEEWRDWCRKHQVETRVDRIRLRSRLIDGSTWGLRATVRNNGRTKGLVGLSLKKEVNDAG